VNSGYDDKLGVLEYGSILMLCLGIKVTDSTPTIFYKSAMNAGWMVPIVSSFIALASLSCLMVLFKRYKDKNLIELIYHLTGNYVGFILSFAITLILISFTASSIRNYADIMSTVYFRKTPVIVLASMLAGSSCIMAKLGIRAVGRTAWLVMPWIMVVVGFFIILVYNLIKVDYIFPILGAGIKPILVGGVKNTAVYGDLIVMSVFFTQVKNYKHFKIASYVALSYGVVVLSFLSAIYLMVLDYPAVIINESPFHTIARLIFGGRFISNLEAFFFLFWIISALVRFSAYTFANAALISYTLKLKNPKRLTAPICAFILIISLAPENMYQNILLVRPLITYASGVVTFSTPFILLFASKRKVES
jgi:spore germination protein (amino acid permease)